MLEIVVTNVEDAINAEKGGASRLEIVSQPNQEGLTPSIEIVKKIRDSVNIPIRVMIRDRNIFEGFSKNELKRMANLTNKFKEAGIQGIVVGFLKNNKIDFNAVEIVLEYKDNLEVTFHRAFDETDNIENSVKELINFKLIDRVLTSGGAETAADGIEVLKKINSLAANKIIIIAGGSVSGENIRKIKKATGIKEFHVGKAVRNNNNYLGSIDPLKVEEIIKASQMPNNSIE